MVWGVQRLGRLSNSNVLNDGGDSTMLDWERLKGSANAGGEFRLHARFRIARNDLLRFDNAHWRMLSLTRTRPALPQAGDGLSALIGCPRAIDDIRLDRQRLFRSHARNAESRHADGITGAFEYDRIPLLVRALRHLAQVRNRAGAPSGSVKYFASGFTTGRPVSMSMPHKIWQADTRARAHQAFERFVAIFEEKYPKAVDYPVKDRGELLAFYDFPTVHRQHLRATNPIESTFATIRLRIVKTKNCVSATSGLSLMHQLAMSAQKRWRRLRASPPLPHSYTTTGDTNVELDCGRKPETSGGRGELFANDSWMTRCDFQKSQRRSFRLSSTLLPVAQSVNADLDCPCEFGLSQADKAS